MTLWIKYKHSNLERFEIIRYIPTQEEIEMKPTKSYFRIWLESKY